MTASKDVWNEWNDTFVEKVMEIVKSEGNNCERRSVSKQLKISKDRLFCAKTISNVSRRNLANFNTTNGRQENNLSTVSIGAIYRATLVDPPASKKYGKYLVQEKRPFISSSARNAVL